MERHHRTVDANKEFFLLFDRVGKDYATISRGTVVNNVRPTGDGRFYFTVKTTGMDSVEPVWGSVLIENTESNLQLLFLLEKIKNQVEVQERALYPLLSTAGTLSLGEFKSADESVSDKLKEAYSSLRNALK